MNPLNRHQSYPNTWKAEVPVTSTNTSNSILRSLRISPSIHPSLIDHFYNQRTYRKEDANSSRAQVERFGRKHEHVGIVKKVKIVFQTRETRKSAIAERCASHIRRRCRLTTSDGVNLISTDNGFIES
jgi:hypothetical protein